MSRPLEEKYQNKLRTLMLRRGRSGKKGRGRALLSKEIGIPEATLARAVRGDRLHNRTADQIEIAIAPLPLR